MVRQTNRIIAAEHIAVMLCPASNGKVYSALIDSADIPIVSGKFWRAKLEKRSIYIVSGTGCGKYGAALRLHQVLCGASFIDHKNGRGSDNRRSNLRPATHSQNGGNRSITSPSGFKGITRLPSGKFQASIRAKGKGYYLGLYATPDDAARAYDQAARKHFGEFARLNFPDGSAE